MVARRRQAILTAPSPATQRSESREQEADVTHDADVIIIGGGMVGMTLAALLGHAGRHVIVVEGSPVPDDPDIPETPDLRVSSVNRGSAALFDRAGAWDGMLARRACPFRRVRVWGYKGTEARFDASETGHEQLGWFIENSVITAALREAVGQLESVEWLVPATPGSLGSDADHASVTLADGTRRTARLIVGADGPSSTVRELAGIRCHETDYQQRALVTNIGTSLPQQDLTWQRFTPRGPQAFLPLSGPNASLVWYESPSVIRDLEALPDPDLAAAIEHSFPSVLGRIEAVHDRASFAIKRRHAETYRNGRVVLVGDAAHAIHPLMGQGLNLGLQGVASLVNAITAEPDTDPGALPTLARYESEHRCRALTMMAATDACHRLFSRERGPLPALGSGLLQLSRFIGPGRRQATRFAMGLA